MSLKTTLTKLEKKKVVTKKPKPVYPFLLAFALLGVWVLIYKTSNSLITITTAGITVFAFIFAILHWFVVKVLNNNLRLRPSVIKVVLSGVVSLLILYMILGFSCSTSVFCFIKYTEFFLSLSMSGYAAFFWMLLFLIFVSVYVLLSMKGRK